MRKPSDFGLPFESLRALSPSKGMVEGRIERQTPNGNGFEARSPFDSAAFHSGQASALPARRDSG